MFHFKSVNLTKTMVHHTQWKGVEVLISVVLFTILSPCLAMAVSFSLDLATVGCNFCIAGSFNFATQPLSNPNGGLDHRLGFQGPQSITTIDSQTEPGSNTLGTLNYASQGSVPFTSSLTMVSPKIFPFPGGPPRSTEGSLIASVTFTDTSESKYSLGISETRIGTQPLRIDTKVQDFTFTGSLPTSSVPIPDMLWPTLVGMIGIVCWAERKRRHKLIMR